MGSTGHPIPIVANDQGQKPAVASHQLRGESRSKVTAKSFGMQQNKLPVDGKRRQCSEAFVQQPAAQSREPTDLRVRLFLVLAIKTMAEKIKAAARQREAIRCLRLLAKLVASKSEDRTLRDELAYVFLELPRSKGAAAIQLLIEDTEEDGFGAESVS